MNNEASVNHKAYELLTIKQTINNEACDMLVELEVQVYNFYR